jgi:hypothetical protein
MSACNYELLTDTNFDIHTSFCNLVKAKRTLAYVGIFEQHVCKNTGVVCGINGVTYQSECEALSGE